MIRIMRIKKYKVPIAAFFSLILMFVLVVISKSIAPSDFPRSTIIRVEKNMTVSEIGAILKGKGIVRSALIYKIYVVLLHDGKGIQAGSYLFDHPQSALRIAYRTAYGLSELQKVKVTIYEGLNSKQIATAIKKNIPSFDAKTFLVEAKKSEGYLFPETYFFSPEAKPDEVIAEMKAQFDKKILAVKDALATSTHSLGDIMIMASILEEEANDTQDRRMIADVLWKRINKGMNLQVDVPFYYIMNKGSAPLTLEDLATTSPYNTYLYKGLPPTPISNPGLDSIRAALFPAKNPYYFYLADKNGVTHYATNHDGHLANRVKYLQ